ncbi:MAG TPA: hypothetical protein VL550_04410 [Rhodocyclaceae bacterium]|nr:hypothetical protein [Rhodocyclaceae bacterium]
MCTSKQLRWTVLLATLTLCTQLAHATVPADLRVLDDEVTEAGETEFEFISTAARSPNKSLDRGTAYTSLAEISYGVAQNWELSLQLPAARMNDGWQTTGATLELQYVAPHNPERGFYWGGRTELGRDLGTDNDDPATWEWEMRSILGYRIDQWQGILNPGITMPVGGSTRRVDFSPSAELSYQVTRENSLGLEYYVDAGPLSQPLPSNRRQTFGVLVFDTHVGESDFQLGIGRGMNAVSESTLLKLRFSIPLND